MVDTIIILHENYLCGPWSGVIQYYLDGVDEQLMLVGKVKTCPEREKYVCILMDEMHIKADLVYDKHSGE